MLTAAADSGLADATQDKDKVLMSEEARASYSLGQKMGATIKRQQLETEIGPFMRGIRDALTGAEPLLTDEEMSAIRTAYFKKHQEMVENKKKELAAKNLEAGKEFLAENAEKEGVVALPSGLQYKIIESGDGKQPGIKDRVSIHYRGTLIDGTEIGSSYGREVPLSFRLEKAIPGHLEALQLMREGDKWQLFLPTELGYGEQGRRGLIGPNEALIFEMRLVSVQEPEAKPSEIVMQPTETEADKSN
jgi:FKBP-type peptidyl-prolyl cis-trans isomerase